MLEFGIQLLETQGEVQNMAAGLLTATLDGFNLSIKEWNDRPSHGMLVAMEEALERISLCELLQQRRKNANKTKDLAAKVESMKTYVKEALSADMLWEWLRMQSGDSHYPAKDSPY